jgi:hypothetical protein
MADHSQAAPYGWVARNICLGALGVFGLVYTLNIIIGLFRDTPVRRPRIIELMGPVAMLCIPIALLAGLVWLWAIISARRAGGS